MTTTVLDRAAPIVGDATRRQFLAGPAAAAGSSPARAPWPAAPVPDRGRQPTHQQTSGVAAVRGGFKVHPERVQAALERHPAVREAAVTGVPDERLGSVPVAAVEIMPGVVAPSVLDLEQYCHDALAPYERPTRIVVVAALPRSPSGKVAVAAVAELVRPTGDAVGRPISGRR